MTQRGKQVLLPTKLQPALRNAHLTSYQSCVTYFTLLLLMPSIIEGYLVPYTLGGTTIMIDASELPAMPSPLLKHVMNGLDKRLKEPGVSSMVHTIKPASKPVKMPPPEPTHIGVNNYKFRAGLPHGSLGYHHYELLAEKPGLSNDFYTNEDGLVHFDILNQDMNGNAIDQEIPTRVQPVDDVNSYNKLNIMTSERPPDLSPLTVKPNIRDGSGLEHVNKEYSGVSVKHLVERHLNPDTKDGVSEMHVNPEPIYEKKSLPKDSGTLLQNFNYDSRESGPQIVPSPEESGQDNEQYSQTFSFPGSEQLLYEKKISNIDSIQKRFAGQPPETDFEDGVRSNVDNDWRSFAEQREDVSVETNPTNLQLHLPSTLVEKINELNDSKYLRINSAQGEKITSGDRSDTESYSAGNVDAYKVSKLEPVAIESVPQSAANSTNDTFKDAEIESDSIEKHDAVEALDVVESRDAPQDTDGTEPAAVFLSANSIPSIDATDSADSVVAMTHENAEGLFKNARRSESDHHRLAVEALEQMRLKNNVQIIVNTLRNDPEKVPAEHISEVLSPGTMSYTHFPNSSQMVEAINKNAPSFLAELVKNSNLGNLVTVVPIKNHDTEAGSTVTQFVRGDSGATGTHTVINSLGAGAIGNKLMIENEVTEIPAMIVGPQTASGSQAHSTADAVDNTMDLEQGLPGNSGDANGFIGSSSAVKGNHELLISIGGKLHSVTHDVFRKDSCNCGIRLSHKIVGGSVATISEFPWMVGLALKAKNFTFCGGTLISDRHILTAAHCVFRFQQEPSALYIKAGASDSSNSPLSLNIKAIRVHPKYSEFNTAFDIAVVALEEPVEFSPTLLPVCPPTDSEPADVYKNGVVIGWGRTDPQGSVSAKLQKATVDLMTAAECRKQSSYDSSKITDKIICASAPGKDSCQGDSGGPLMVSNSNIIEAIGIVSWGIGCAEEQHPGVYTKIYSYRTWIKAMTRSGTKCEADPIVQRAVPEKVFDYRKEHNIFSAFSNDGVELYPALRPAERYRNKFLLQFEEPESFVFRSPILDDKIEGFDYVSENSSPIIATESGIGARQQSKTQANTFDRSSVGVPLVMTPEPVGNDETFIAGKIRETSRISDVPGNFHPSSTNRHTAAERAVMSQSFQSTLPISYEEGEDLADVFKLVNDELTFNDERSPQDEADDGISLSIGNRNVPSQTAVKRNDLPHEDSIIYLAETLTQDDQSDSDKIIEEPFEQNTSSGNDLLQNVPIEELMREESRDEKLKQESSTGQNLVDTSNLNQPINEIPYKSHGQKHLVDSQPEGDVPGAGNRPTLVKPSIETTQKEPLEKYEFFEQTKTENLVGQGLNLEAVAHVTPIQAATLEELPIEEAAIDQQVKSVSAADNQPNIRLTAEQKPNSEIPSEEHSNFAITVGEMPSPGKKADEQSISLAPVDIVHGPAKNTGEQPNIATTTNKIASGEKHGPQILQDGAPNPVTLVTKQPQVKTKEELSPTSATDVGKEQESSLSKPLIHLGSLSSFTDGDSFHNRKSSQNALYQNILDRIRIATDRRNAISLLQSGSSSISFPGGDSTSFFKDDSTSFFKDDSTSLSNGDSTSFTNGPSTSFSNDEITHNAENDSPVVQIVTRTDSPSEKPDGINTSLITIADVLGQNAVPVSTSAPLDIEAIEALIHNLGQNERKLETENFGETLAFYKRDTDKEQRMEATTPVEFNVLYKQVNSNMRNANENVRTEEKADADLVSAIQELQDEIIRNISKRQPESEMMENTRAEDTKGANNTIVLGQHVIEISKPNFLNLSTSFDTTTTTPISENGRPPIKPEDQTGTGEIQKISEDRDVIASKESGIPGVSTPTTDHPIEETNSILIEAHSIEIGGKNGYITLKNFTIGRPGYNFSLTFDDIDNRTTSVLGKEQPKKELGSDAVITLNNFTIGSPGFNFTLDFVDVEYNVTARKNISSHDEVLDGQVENNSSVQMEPNKVFEDPMDTPDTQNVRREQTISENTDEDYKRQKGNKLTVINAINRLKNNINDDTLVRYVIRKSEDNEKIPVQSSTYDTKLAVPGTTSTTSGSTTEDVKGGFGESEEPVTNETEDVAAEGLQTGTDSPQIHYETENVTELVPKNGTTSEGGATPHSANTRQNTKVGTDVEVQSVTTDQNASEEIGTPTEPTDETTDESAVEIPMVSSTHRPLEKWERLRFIQRRIAKIQDEEKPEEDHSFLGMIQRHIFPASTSRRRINDKVRAYRKPEDDLNEALSKIFSHYDYYDESDASWG